MKLIYESPDKGATVRSRPFHAPTPQHGFLETLGRLLVPSLGILGLFTALVTLERLESLEKQQQAKYNAVQQALYTYGNDINGLKLKISKPTQINRSGEFE